MDGESTVRDEVGAFYEDFGERVRRARGSMSQAALGALVGISRASISNIEAGRQHPPLHLLPRLARALGVEPAQLIGPAELGHDVDVTGLIPEERHFVASVIAAAKGRVGDGQG